MVRSLSIRAFARRAGCDEKAIRRRIQSGLLLTLEDGKLDAALLEGDWRNGAAGADTAADTSTPPSTFSNGSLIRQVLAEEGQDIGGAALTLTHVRMAVGILKAREQAIENDRVRGALIEIEAIGKAVGEEYAIVRALCTSMPGEIAPELEGLPAIEIQERLAAKISEILTALSADDDSQSTAAVYLEGAA